MAKKKDAASPVPALATAPATAATPESAAPPAAATPAGPTKEEKAAARAVKAADRAADKAKAKEEAKLAKDANRQPMQNGIRRPGPNGLCGRGWTIMDQISKDKGAPAAAKEVKAATDAAGLHWGNIVGEYAKWRKFHGLTGRIYAKGESPAEKPAKAPKAPAADTQAAA